MPKRVVDEQESLAIRQTFPCQANLDESGTGKPVATIPRERSF